MDLPKELGHNITIDLSTFQSPKYLVSLWFYHVLNLQEEDILSTKDTIVDNVVTSFSSSVLIH